jgi:hypothetical protein
MDAGWRRCRDDYRAGGTAAWFEKLRRLD